MPDSYRFGCFELRPQERALLSSGQPVRVGARAFDILSALIERRDRLVEFDELLDVVWPGLEVEENNLSVQISTIRKLLGNHVITTVRGRGYRFSVPVESVQTAFPSAQSEDAQELVSSRTLDAALQTRMSQAMLPSIAIVPFASPLAGGSTIGIGDVLADQLISALSSSSTLNVLSRLSTTVFRDRKTSLSQIASSLSAHFVVSGSCWVSNGQLIANVELADSATQAVLWSQTISDSVEGVLHLDSDSVLNIAGGITRAILAAEVRAATTKPLPDLATHTLLLSAIELLYRISSTDFQKANVALIAVRERAPTHPLPLAWLARWHLFRVFQGWSENSVDDARQAYDLARRALDIDPFSPLALTMLGDVNTSYFRDLDKAEALYASATKCNPNEPLAWLQWGNARSFRSNGSCATQYVERAIRLSPLDPARHCYDSIMSGAALAAGQYDRAIGSARAALVIKDDHAVTCRVLAIALALSGRLIEARAVVDRILELEPRFTVEAFVRRNNRGADPKLAQKFAAALESAGLPLT